MKTTKEKLHQAHRKFEVFKVQHGITIENAIRSADTAHEAREKDATTFSFSRDKLLKAEEMASQKYRALALENKESRLQIKQMSQIEDHLREELREALSEKKNSIGSLVEIEARHITKFKVSRFPSNLDILHHILQLNIGTELHLFRNFKRRMLCWKQNCKLFTEMSRLFKVILIR